MSKSKKHILIFVDWYLPGYRAGGPIRSVANMVATLSDDFRFSIITSDTDYGEQYPYPDIPAAKWLNVNGVRVMYLDRKHQSFSFIRRLLKNEQFDHVYLNSLFSFYFSILPLILLKWDRIKVPVTIAPRGMLGAGALKVKSVKKQIYLWLTYMISMYKQVLWHATNDGEKEDILNYFGPNSRIVVASNIAFSKSGNGNIMKEKQSGAARFFYLSRIMKVKNLKGALSVLASLNTNGKIEYDIIGPVEDESYWKDCRSEIEKLDKNVIVRYLGAIPNEDLDSFIRDYHFLFLPTTTENYGHSIVESLAMGCPVIISDQTPWKGLEAKNIGWDIPLNETERFKSTLEKCVKMTQDEYDEMSKNTRRFARENIFNGNVISQNRKLFGETNNHF